MHVCVLKEEIDIKCFTSIFILIYVLICLQLFNVIYVCVCVRGYEVIDDVVFFAVFLSLEN